MSPVPMYAGRIKTVNEKGYGFISRTNAKPDLFFHLSDLSRNVRFESLKVGDIVLYDEGMHDNRPRAVNIEVCSGCTCDQGAQA